MRVSLAAIATLALSQGLQIVHGYGILGHTLTGQVAQLLLTPETARQVKEILSPYYDGLLSKAAPWPDTIKMRPQYRWASVFHYVNTPGDDPPDHCMFEYNGTRHDVVNGIFNMTATLMHYKAHPPPPRSQRPQTFNRYRDIGGGRDEEEEKEWGDGGFLVAPRYTDDEGDAYWTDDDGSDNSDPGMVDRSIREDALRFFVHFMGDIHQPLHTAGKARGGNDAPARWRRAKTNLHKIWDSQMIMKDIKDRFDNDPKAYLDNMMELTTTFWTPASVNWTLCGGKDEIDYELVDNPWATPLQDPTLSPRVLHHLCPKAWAREMNSIACEYAWRDYLGPEGDHSQGYHERATGKQDGFLVQRLIAKSGVRMAAILNTIYDPDNAEAVGMQSWRLLRGRQRKRPQQEKYQQIVDMLQGLIDAQNEEEEHGGYSRHFVAQHRFVAPV